MPSQNSRKQSLVGMRIYFSVFFYSPAVRADTSPSVSSFFSTNLMTVDIDCLFQSDLMFSLALHFNLLTCRSLYLPGNVSPDCLGNSLLPVCNESGQRLEQLNRRDNQSLIQTAMQNMQAIPSENVLSGILDFKLLLINLKGSAGRVWWCLPGGRRRGWNGQLPGNRTKNMSTCNCKRYHTCHILSLVYIQWTAFL